MSCTREHLTAQRNYYSGVQSQWLYFTDNHYRQDVLKFYKLSHTVRSPWADLRLLVSPAYFSIAVLCDYRHSHLGAALTDCPVWDPAVWFAGFPAVAYYLRPAVITIYNGISYSQFPEEKNLKPLQVWVTSDRCKSSGVTFDLILSLCAERCWIGYCMEAT